MAPAVFAGSVFLLRIWIFQAFQNFPEDTYLGAVVYPFVGAVAGGVVGFGVSEFFRGDVMPGTAYVFAGMAITVYAGGSIAKDRAREEEKPPDSFSVEEWRRDLDYLRGLHRVSREDRREFEERARELAAHGKQECEMARRHRFGVYWRSRRRRARILAYAWIAFGLYVAANQASDLRKLTGRRVSDLRFSLTG